VTALDDRDRRIVAALARDAWLSYVDLGAAVDLSPSAVQRRVEKLIAAGVIVGARASISPEALGKPLRLYVMVELVDESKAALNRFAKKIAAWPDLVEAHYVAGSSDIVLVLQASNMEAYAAFADEHLNVEANVHRFKTLTSLRRLY
jgi:Lrp/AsnC family transcriptional regulator, leucine-responsive regulatory protein